MSLLRSNRDALKLKQSAALNRYAAPELWLPWSSVMRKVGNLWPILLLIAVFGLEIAFFRWAQQPQDGPSPTLGWGRVVMTVMLLPTMVPLLVPLMVWGERSSPRMLKLNARGLTCSGRKPRFFRWSELLKVEVEPIAEKPALARVSITGRAKANLPPRSWTILLDRTMQWAPLLERLKRRHAAVPNFTVREFHQAKPEVPRLSLNARLVWPIAVMMFLVCNGLPLLMAGLRLGDAAAPRSAHTERIRPRTPAQRFVAANFHSVRSLRCAFLISGGAMTVATVGLFVWHNRRMNAFAQKNQELYCFTEIQLEKLPHDVCLQRRA